MNRKKLLVLGFVVAVVVIVVVVLVVVLVNRTGEENVNINTCDQPQNALLPFCDSSLTIDTRVTNLVSRLTVQEKIGLLVNRAAGASENVELDYYNWWNEALHGVANDVIDNLGTHFRPPTEYSTVFPQIISLSTSFDRDLFFRMANATGNEARAFYNAGNAGLTFWSPNVNIYRDPRWGRGQETPGEDPYLNSEYARMFVQGLQGDEEKVGFLKVSACCKHFAAHSIEEGRNSFDAVVNEQDMADTYLPAFKVCVENNVTSIMTAYSAINGIPATANKYYITNVIREQWGFDGYIVSDCGAVDDVFYNHKYEDTESGTCHAVLDAGVDVECGSFYTEFLQRAVTEGQVTEALMDTALSRGFRVLMRLGYFEKDDVRPYKEFLPEDVDSEPHKQLSLEAARRSIVLLKNNLNEITSVPLLPLNEQDFGVSGASMALIGPHLNASEVFMGNYHGIPSSIKVPLDEIQSYVPDLRWELGCAVDSFDIDRLNEAEELARTSSQVVLFVGIDSEIEGEFGDRLDISLTALQPELIRRVLDVAQQPVILFVVSGGVIDLSEYKNDPRVGAIVWAGYIGQSGGEAIADVLFGNYNPSGRLTQTFYDNSYLEQVIKQDMNMRPVNGSPGRTYRFYTGEPVYPFGYGLSYTTFQYTFASENNDIQFSQFASDCLELDLVVQNVGQRSGDHSVLWFVAPPNAGQAGRPIKNLVEFEKLHNVLPSESRQIQICLRSSMFQLANERGEFEVILGEWTLVVGDETRSIIVTGEENDNINTCDKPQNALLPFCDSSLTIDTRVTDLVSRLTVQEKIGLLVNRAAGASENVRLDYYNWWNEALHGVADDVIDNLGTHFRPPTEHSTVFPQIISLSTSFDRDLFFRIANATGNEARAFYNAGNAGLTFWSPNINIYRDPRWGRGQETPGEDPYLNSEYGRMFVQGLQGDEEKVGFLKVSACCKHFAAHSIEEGRNSFDAVVNEQDMADTYLPAFKVCVENNVTSIMTAYSAINGIPATANKYYITNVIREQWGFDGYIVSDCGAVDDVFYNHKYEDTESGTCHAVLDAGVDVECGSFYTEFLQRAVTEGQVTEALMDTALSRGFRVLMRLGYFEKDDVRPYKEFLPEDVDSEPHKQLSLEAARRSIVLLKNNLNEITSVPLLPLNEQDFGVSGASMALIGPHLNASEVFMGNYHGIPSSIKVPLDEIQSYVPDLRWELGCAVDSFDIDRLNEAEELARTSSQVVLFVGIDSEIEGEFGDRLDISLTALQPELIRRVLNVAQQPVILFVVSGGVIDLSEYKNDPRVGAIVWAGYIGQSGGEAIADVLFGNYNPSGRLTQTFYDNSYLEQVIKQDMNMRPVNGSPGRTYRFYTGEPVYPFGYGLSYTTFQYTFASENNDIQFSQFASDCLELDLVVQNVGQRSGDHSVLWFVAPPNAGQAGRPIKNLVEFEKLHNVLPSESRQIQICLRSSMFQLANERGEFEVILGEWTLVVGDETRSIIVTGEENDNINTCDKPQNALLPFCDSSLTIDTRVTDLVSRLTVQEKIGLLVNRAAGASENVRLDYYNWWNEALHGVADDVIDNLGTHFRPPTEHSTVFPQIISLSTSFDRDLFFRIANATGNEARAFYNAGNAGLTFWSPNINIYRDPRWGRGQETPGEDPYLNSEYGRMFVQGLQGDEEKVGFLKVSACCKHFAAHSIEEGRNSFDAVVNEQDMADTYLPAFKVCVENNVTSIMTAYSAINGIPATANKYYITNVIREQWGFDGYIVSDCGAVDDVFYNHKYEDTESGTCHAVLDAGVDVECGSFYTEFLQRAVTEGQVTEALMDTALSRGFRVLMRLGYFEKDDVRPYKEFLPEDVDSEPHKQLSLEAARRSIVLLKNNLNEITSVPLLPLNEQDFGVSGASMALIGPHLNASEVFMGNYHGIPSSIKVPLDEIQSYVPDLRWELGCAVDSFDIDRLNEAEELARTSSQVVLFVGIDSEIEGEFGDRLDISLTALQPELIRRVLNVAQQPVILFVVSGGVIDLSEYKNDPRVGAIVWAGYIGQSGGEAIADVLFGNYNPSGRLTQTFYDNSYLEQVIKQDMNMRPVNGSPGRTYRFYTGEPVYPFGYGLSYTTFQYTFASENNDIQFSQFASDCLELDLVVQNVGQRSGDHSVLWFVAPPNAGQAGRPIKNLVEFEKLHNVLPSESRQIQICLRSSMFQLANERGEFEVILGEWTLVVGDETRSIIVTGEENDNINTCDKPQNALLPFCDSSLTIDTRVTDLVSRLTVQEKIGLLVNRAAGASENVRLDYYNWWNEALHGVADDVIDNLGTHFRPPTEHSTVFPQIISLSTSFDRDLFFRIANATGNEARAFYNAGNAGLTFWSPNINIYRDPRWGRGQETPGEDPYLNSEYGRMFVQGLQGDEEKVGFLKVSACCKHFAAHSIEEGRNSFDAVVNEQDMADTYLPAFKVCVENNVTSIMTAYSAINGIPATANKYYITNVIREQWGFDGYIVSDCGAVDDVFYNHKYEDTESGTCHAVLDAGVDVECGSFYTEFLQRAVTEGQVTEALMDTALSRGFRVLMRLGYFEKDDVRPYKEFLPEDVDSEPHKQLSLEAARRSIVLLKNNLNEITSVPLLPLNEQDFGVSGASMALIGPHLNASEVFMGNYHGIPSSIKVPLDEIQSYVPDLRWELGCAVDSFDIDRLNEAEELARTSSQVVLFVGIDSEIEGEFGDRLDISLTALQPELIRRVLNVAQQPVILFVVSGGVIDLSEYKNDPRVGAIVWAGYIGQSGGEAIADVLFGNYNPSGRLTQTFYDNSYLEQVIKQDMNMRPVNGSPGRTYRFYTGEPVYPFGYGLSYTTFQYTFASENNDIQFSQFASDCLELDLVVQNVGQRSGDHSVLWFVAPPNAGQAGRPIKNLVEFEKLHNVLPSESRQIQICLRSSMFQLANERGEFEVILGEWTLVVGDETRSIIVTGEENDNINTCDKPQNALLPFCDSSLTIDTRVTDLVSRLTVQEKIGLLVNRAAGASENVRLDYYNWWNEALHGVADDVIDNLGTHFRPPTEHSTVFPQIISLSTSFDRDLFFRIANATGNEARAFYNAGNAGLTFWSPNINIYRDPRWGRGQETPGEDPYLNSEYGRMFVQGLQGDEEKVGFLKVSACCKHFAAHSIEEGRNSFDAVVNEQDMADTYLPAFKVCVENNVTSIMTAYSAINGIPATANKYYITNVIREQWGFDGYIVSDCGAVDDVFYNHKYEDTESGTCHAVLDAGVDVECGSFYTEFLQRAVTEGQVTEALMDTALSRGFRVLMRLGYFEKDDVRPYKEFLPEDVDSEPHKQLSLEAARRSIVLLKNNLNEITSVPLLPLNEQDFGVSGASMALIGPHLNASEVFMGNYHGIPSSIKVPLDEIQSYVPDLRWELGCAVDSFDIDRLNEAEELARTSSQVVLFVGIDSEIEGEFGDRLDISLTALQPELIRRVLNVAQQPVILFVVSGGVIDLSEYKNDPRVGAIVWAGYIGQSGGEAIADVLFGNYNPSGRLTQTFYDNSYLEQVIKQDMNMRPVNGSPGRTYRFYTGEPVYPFGYGLSYTTFQYTFASENNDIQFSQFASDCLELDLVVQNVGQRSGDHSVLWFVAPPNAGQAGRPIKNLVEFEKLHNVLPSESRQIQICLRSSMFQLANERGEFEVILGEWTLVVGDETRSIIVTGEENDNINTCDKPQNALLPFCDSSLTIDTRVTDLVSRLTVQEKIGLLVNRAAGASENVRLDYYNWWNEALHGVADDVIDNLGTHFRPPTEHSTVFPQIISLSTSFDRDLFFRIANATGNEARAFYNAGNAGLTFWSPNINIYRDPRWGRGQETPGEDPYLNSEYGRMFVQGLQGDEEKVGFLKVSACCKHFAAHSIEEGRNSFDAVVNEQDMADTYLPAFKVCVENNVTSIMTAYSAINGIPATANKYYITNVIREQWGFDGYIVSDCGAVDDVFYNHKYEDTESGTCHAVLDAGVDVECGSFYTEFLQRAVTEGQVTEALMDTALSRGFRVLMRLGYFEKDDVRPYKEFLPEDVDSEPHKQLSLEAARRSIVLLKNNLNEITSVPLLPLNEQDFGVSGASMALIGPHLNASEVFMGNYHGIPSSIKVPLDEIQSYVPDLRWELGCAVDSFDIDRLNEAEELARTSSQVVLFVGIDSEIEGEFGDRLDISLTALQPELIRRVLNVAQQPVILFVVSGGVIDLSEYKNDPRVGAIVWAGYIGQSGGEAIADVLFGNYNPSGRLTQTFYDNSYLEQVIKQDMNMRPVNGSPGRTYRFYTGEPVYPFGYGLSYTTFQYTFASENNDIQFSQFASDCLELDLVVQNVGQRSGDHSVLWFVAPPNAGQAGRPIKNLVEFEKLHNVLPSESRQIQICLRSSMFQLANERGEFEVILGEWTLVVGDETRSIIVTGEENDNINTCDKPQNALLPFCDSSLTIDTRVTDLVSRLTVQEKIGLLVNRAAGASENVGLDYYNWWNEGLHGVANDNYDNLGTYFRPPTEHSTVFPQIISLSTSFDRDLFFRIANATGNEARAFYNAGNAGLTFWSPNINIYRDPRWGRGQETPGEDPYLNSEYARMFVQGLQGDEEKVGFLKVSACCKHFAAHSIEEGRNSFDAVVNEQDMADTYLPAFKVCVENNVTSIMTAYSAINGIPATANKYYITNVIREEWGFDGYIVSDCAAVNDVFYNHKYEDTESGTCHAVLDAGVDVECGSFYTEFLQRAVTEGQVTEALMDTALSRGFRVLMRLGYFEKDDVRPYKEFLPEDVDSEPHKQLSLEAARRSIVLLKNSLNELTAVPLLPLNEQDFGVSGASMALIGPHLNASEVFMGNYHGIPSSIKMPLDEIQSYVPDLRWELGCAVDSFDIDRLNEAEELARTSSQVVLFVGINSRIERESGDRPDISLTALQPELIRRVLDVAQQPIILFVVSGGAIDLSEYKNDPRVGAIVWAGYIGQSGGEAIADVLFGNYNPSGRLTQTFYDNSYLEQVIKQDMNMRPVNGSPGRTYRFYTGEPVYPFGYGLSYTTFQYTFASENNDIQFSQFASDCLELDLVVQNVGQRSGDHSVLWFVAPPNAGEAGRPIKNLVEFEKLHNVLPSESRQIQICLRSSMFQLANERGEFEVILGEWTLVVGDETRNIIVT